MPRRYLTPGLLWLGFVVSWPARAEPPRGTDLAAVWNYAAGSQPIEARATLKDLEGVDERARTLAGAVLDLARPPLSDGDWNRIEPVLARLAKGDDEIAAQALYLQARMYQVQKSTPDYGRTEQLYGELARRWPGSHWAQLGYVKLGLIKLFALPEPADPHQRLTSVEAVLARITEPVLRRDLLLQMGWAGLHYELPLDEILPHLIAADQIGGLMGITPEDLVIQIGELSFRAGYLHQARRYFERFFAEFPTSTRVYNVRQRMDELEAALAAAEGRS